MKRIILTFGLVLTGLALFGQSPRIRLNQITKDSLTGSVVLSGSDSNMVYSRDFFLNLTDSVLILFGDTLSTTATAFTGVATDLTLTGNGTVGNELKVDTAVIATIKALADSVATRGTVTGITAGTFLSGGTITTSGTIALDTASAGLKTYISDNKGTVDLASGVTGTLPVANGGTGSTTQNFVDLTTTQTISGAKTFTAALTQSGGDANFDSNTLYVDATNNRVGIGTSSPSVALDVVGSLQTTGYFSVEGTSGNTGLGTDRWIGGDGTAGTWFYNVPTGFNHYFAVNNTNTLGINSAGIDVVGTATINGNVGIGTTTPTAVLHLKAGTASANTAPLKFTSGTNLTTPEAGAMEWNGTNLFLTNSGATRQTINQGLTGSATLDFGSTSAQSSADLTITVTGASDGDVVSLGVPNGSVNANTSYSAWVSAANTVTVRFNNYSSGSVDPASGTFKVFVTKF